jgi:Uma2 family endonuclease
MEAKTLLSAEDVLEMGDIGRWELVKGELIKMAPTGGTHGELTATLAHMLRNFVKPRKLGKVFGAETGFLRLAPDLAVEVMSPEDTYTEVEEKVAEYLSAGVRLIWIVVPKTQGVVVYRPRKDAQRLSREDTLTGEDVLPGFETRVAELFE